MLERSPYAKMANDISSRMIKIDTGRLETPLGPFRTGRAVELCEKTDGNALDPVSRRVGVSGTYTGPHEETA